MSVLGREDIIRAMQPPVGGTPTKYDLLEIDPFDLDSVQPASVDLTLADDFARIQHGQFAAPIIDTAESVVYSPFKAQTQTTRWTQELPDRKYIRKEITEPHVVLRAGEFILGTTVEKVRIPNHLVARVEGKSSLGRIGLAVHITAGYVDPGFEGQITLEIKNNAHVAIVLYPGMKICQLAFEQLATPVAEGYSGRYQNQEGATGSKVHEQVANTHNRDQAEEGGGE